MRSTDRGLGTLALLLGLLLTGCARSGAPAGAPDPAPFAAGYPTYENLDEMRHDTEAVVVAETTGQAASPRPLPESQVADYFQQVRVLDVLLGAAPKAGTVVTIVRLGMAGPSPRGGIEDHVAYGPLDPGRRVLFLRAAGEPGAWSIVGHFQGDIPLAGERTSGGAFKELRGRTPEQIRALLAGPG